MLAALAVTPAHADEAAVIHACVALADLSRALVELRYAGIPQAVIDRHVVEAQAEIDAPLTADLAWRAFRLPDTSSAVTQARFRASTGATVENECLTRLSAAITEGGTQ
jgi:hypothetical protein